MLLVGQLVRQLLGWSVDQSFNQRINLLICKSINRLINYSVNRSISWFLIFTICIWCPLAWHTGGGTWVIWILYSRLLSPARSTPWTCHTPATTNTCRNITQKYSNDPSAGPPQHMSLAVLPGRWFLLSGTYILSPVKPVSQTHRIDYLPVIWDHHFTPIMLVVSYRFDCNVFPRISCSWHYWTRGVLAACRSVKY